MLIHIFDCDGVILDSNDFKVESLLSALKYIDCKGIFLKWVEDNFRENFGRTRLEHFRVIQENSLRFGYQLSDDKLTDALERYSDLVSSGYGDCRMVEETNTFISGLPRDQLIFVVSGSDQQELRQFLPSKNSLLTRDRIFGGPLSKVRNIQNIISNCGTAEYFYYGDAVQDAKAARASGVNFVGLSKYSSAPRDLEDFCAKHSLQHYTDCSAIAGRV